MLCFDFSWRSQLLHVPRQGVLHICSNSAFVCICKSKTSVGWSWVFLYLLEALPFSYSNYIDVLVAPVRVAQRLTDLSDVETADLFNLSKKVTFFIATHILLWIQVQRMIEKQHDADSATVCVQDGPNSGQTVKVCWFLFCAVGEILASFYFNFELY